MVSGAVDYQQIVAMKIVYVPKDDSTLSLSNIFAIVTSQATPFSHVTWDSRKRYKILWSRIFVLQADNRAQKFSIRLNLKGKKAYYVAATTTSAAGSLWLVTCTGNNSVDPPTIRGRVRLTYTG